MIHKYNEAAILAAAIVSGTAFAQPAAQPAPQPAPAARAPAATAPRTNVVTVPGTTSGAALRPCESVTVDPPLQLTLGKSRIVRLPFPAARMVVGGNAGSRAGRPVASAEGQRGTGQRATDTGSDFDGVAETDISLLSPTELYFLGRGPGSMNVVLQSSDGRCLVKDLIVTIDPETVQAKLGELMPEETGIKVRAADNAIVLTGSVSDAIKLDQVVSLASAYGDGKKVVNLLRVSTPQQVMLEVKIAEVSKTILDTFGIDYTRVFTTADGRVTRMLSGLFGGDPGTFARFSPNLSGGAVSGFAGGVFNGASGAASATVGTSSRGSSILGLDMQKKDGVVRVLAEPNIMAISGQAASFLSGGKIFIPIAQNRDSGGTTITLEEKEFGVGLKFTPTVLDGSRINLKLISEASELSQTGSPFTSFNGVTAVMPSMATRRVDTTVQLNDGQSFVVAGLIKNNYNEALTKFPGLGEVPVMGALFRSTEFQNDQTELMFVVTPRLVKASGAPIVLPTDNHVAPNRNDAIWRGSGEGTAPAARPATVETPAAVPAQVAPPTAVPAQPLPPAAPRN